MGGSAIGGYFGGPNGAAVGHAIGAGVSRVVGTGDYKVESNSILANNQVPDFTRGKRSIRIRHAEFLTDVTSSINFSDRGWIINPGNASTFPWLSHIAANFQSYKIHGMLFEFKSTAAFAVNNVNVALGTVIMSTMYNVNRPDFSSKLEMESYEFACSGRPTENMLHAIECAPGEAVLDQLYIRSGAVPAGEDARFYDYGKFQLATVGMQAASTIGELWVTYDIEFFKPRIQPGGSIPGLFTRISNGAYTNAAPLGSIQTTPVGDLGITVGAGFASLVWPSDLSTGRYLVRVRWAGGGSVVLAGAAPTLSNLTRQNYMGLGTIDGYYMPAAGATASQSMYETVVTVNGYSAAGSSLTFSGMTLPSAQVYCDILVVALPLVDNYV